jgi:hypothetical protein
VRVTWTWANQPDDESDHAHPVQQGRRARRTARTSIEDDTTHRAAPPPRHHSERNRHV